MKRGEAGTTTLAENVAALPMERYRVEKHLIADPADVDGDCIDDITELDDLGNKNPVNPAIAISPATAPWPFPIGEHSRLCPYVSGILTRRPRTPGS